MVCRTPRRRGTPTRSSSEQQFLLEDPRNSGASGARAATAKTDSDSISLAALKARITTIEAELTAGGVSDAYRDCVVTTYQWNRASVDDRLIETTIASGLPAETIVHTFEDAAEITLSLFGPTKPAVGAGEHWLEGPDSHLFGYKYPGHQYLLRPLPAGSIGTSTCIAQMKWSFATATPMPCGAREPTSSP